MDCFEKDALDKGYSLVAGIDEAGRGPLAGPVVAAAVVFDTLPLEIGIKDSKALTPRRREYLFEEIKKRAVCVGIGIVEPQEIDKINILKASLKAMEKSVRSLSINPQFLLIDGRFPIELDIPQKTVIKGDSISVTIAAASIIAKVTRDRIMESYHKRYPVYGFNRHKGYGTEAHLMAIERYGPLPIHRKSFKGVKEHI